MRPWRSAWPGKRWRPGEQTCSSWARSPRTRRRTTWSRCWPCCAGSTTPRRACTWWDRRWGRPTSPHCAPSSPSSVSTTPSTWRDRSARRSSRPTCRRRTCSSAPPSTRASACRWPKPWVTGSRSWPTGWPRSPRRWGARDWCCPTSHLPRSPPRWGGSCPTRRCADISPPPVAPRADGFSLSDSQRHFVSLLQEAIGSPGPQR